MAILTPRWWRLKPYARGLLVSVHGLRLSDGRVGRCWIRIGPRMRA